MSRRRLGPLGRIRTWSASSGPCAASASTTWWCSTRPTCVACCATTSPTTTVPGPTSPWRRTPRSRDRWSASTKVGSSRPPWSAASIIATRARRRKIRPACGGDRPRGSRRSAGQRGSPRSSSAWSLKLHTEHVGPRGVLRSQGPVLLTNGRSRSFEHLDGLGGRSSARRYPEICRVAAAFRMCGSSGRRSPCLQGVDPGDDSTVFGQTRFPSCSPVRWRSGRDRGTSRDSLKSDHFRGSFHWEGPEPPTGTAHRAGL